MKKLLMLSIITVLVALLTLPALAQQDNDKKKAKKNVTSSAQIEAKRDKTNAKAHKIAAKREAARERVDTKMQQRLKLIQQDESGNTGLPGN